MNSEALEIIDGLLWCAENFNRELDRKMKDSITDDDYSYYDMGKKQAVEAIEKAELFVNDYKRRSRKMSRKFEIRLKFPIEVEAFDRAIALRSYQGYIVEEGEVVNGIEFSRIWPEWLIEIEEKSEAEGWAKDRVVILDPKKVEWEYSHIIEAHEAGQKTGALKERERFAWIVEVMNSLAGHEIEITVQGELFSFLDIMVDFEKLNKKN